MKYKLSNGLTVIQKRKQSDSVTIQLTVKVGSNYEKEGIRGISHFIEHMLFEGTKTRKDAKEISTEIESLGGEMNAYTNNVRTCFYIKVPKKHFKKAAEILADMVKNSVFDEQTIEKERRVILKEINIFNDESRYYQWILFEKNLFSKHPAKWPAYGTREDVSSIGRKEIVGYYEKHYTAANSILSVVGDVDSKDIIEKYFSDLVKGEEVNVNNEQEENSHKTIKESRKIMNSYMVLGYKVKPRVHDDSYVLDVIQAVLGKGQSGKLFDEIRNKRGLAYEVGVHHDPSIDFGYFAVYLSADKSKIEEIKEIIVDEFEKLGNITDKELKDAKGYLEGRYILDKEDTHNVADAVGFWELISDCNLEDEYLGKISKVSKEDVARVAKEYLDENYTLAIIEPK